MQAITYLSSVCALVLAFAGCRHDDPYFCEGAPHNNCLAIDGGAKRCTADGDCTVAGAGVCDTQSMTCVQCTAAEHTACSGTSPVCGADDSCRGCSSHADCPDSNVCLPDGSCAATGDVAYVVPAPDGTDNPTCTMASPCTKVVMALATGRSYVKLHGTTDEAVTIKDRNVTVLADPGATLTRTSNGNILVIDGTSDVKIYDLAINGASGSGAGVSLPSGGTQSLTLTRVAMSGNNGTGGAISASGGRLTVTRSEISRNTGGGISVMNGTFDVVGNVFSLNGVGAGTVGGINILVAQSTANRLEFNSFNQNTTQVGIGAAIQCTAGTFTARNNIMSENGTLANLEQVGGTCAHTYSIARPGTLPLGIGNIASDPLFKNTAMSDLHIQSGSPAAGAADPGSDLTGIAAHDIDGDSRTKPADMGADEVRP